ncbi:SRPBCC domain-containing protein [Paenibacillus thiaminolyticus]|uniref:SRPBCC family protein n=1 Tax=Paenibacillus thiaminolyticus TaxID=49283 RepID=UPI003D2AE480
MTHEYTSVKRDIVVHAPPEAVWKALTVPEERNRWETAQCRIDLAIGGTVELDYGWGVTYTGTVVELEANRRLVLADEHHDLTIWTLEPHPEGTRVEIEYTGMWTGDLGMMRMENMAFGTGLFLRNLQGLFQGGPDIRSSIWLSWIGAHHRTHAVAALSGSVIVEVVAGTPADGVLSIGDIITDINGMPVHGYDDLESVVTRIGPGQVVKLGLLRDGKRQEVQLTTVPFGAKRDSSIPS